MCIESDGKAHGMGHLNKGFVFRVSLDLARRQEKNEYNLNHLLMFFFFLQDFYLKIQNFYY